MSLLLLIPYSPSLNLSVGSRHGSPRDLHRPTCELVSVSTSSLLSDTTSHPFLSKTAGRLSAYPSSHAFSPCVATSSPLADPMPSLALLCPPVTTLANSELSYRVNGGKAGLSLLQPIPSAEVRSRPCNGPSYLVRAGRTPSPLTWLPDFPVSDTTIPFLCLGTLITPAINLSFLELFLLLSPTHQAQEQSSAFSSPN